MMKPNLFLTNIIADGINARLNGAGFASVERGKDGNFYILLDVNHHGNNEVIEVLKSLHVFADSTECYHNDGVVVYHYEEGVNVYALFNWERFKEVEAIDV